MLVIESENSKMNKQLKSVQKALKRNQCGGKSAFKFPKRWIMIKQECLLDFKKMAFVIL